MWKSVADHQTRLIRSFFEAVASVSIEVELSLTTSSHATKADQPITTLISVSCAVATAKMYVKVF